ncbi:unnamed protein product [Vicia faba]|uniref:Uncharacterized protein n=1 Tax=Vicia faba TaxID=3906 RepID=A0AAV0ZX71_VICFA|nr:unnamed protein product [Vicia faba]
MIKVDLSKAYDKISWECIYRVLVEIQLPENMINNIMHAVSSALRNRPTLKSLSISYFDPDDENYLISHFLDSLLTLKGLTCLDLLGLQISDDFLSSIATEGLPLNKFVLRSCTGYTYDGICFLLSNCSGIQHLSFHRNDFLNDHHIAQLSLFLGGLVSIRLSDCWNLTKSALFALIRNCSSLSEITMEGIGTKSLQTSNSFKDFHVNAQLKSLCLTYDSSINDANIFLFASIFPNLELLDLTSCDSISERAICQVLTRCCTRVDDKTLYEISKSCSGLLHLSLRYCKHVTENGVMHVVQNCTQLKEIDLKFCYKVDADIVVSETVKRDIVPPCFLF